MAFYTAGPTSFLYNGTPLEAVDRFKYLGVILTKDGRLKAEVKAELAAVEAAATGLFCG